MTKKPTYSEILKAYKNLKRAYSQYKRRHPVVDYQAYKQLKADFTDLQLSFNEQEKKLNNCIGGKADKMISSYDYINQHGISKKELDEWHEAHPVKKQNWLSKLLNK